MSEYAIEMVTSSETFLENEQKIRELLAKPIDRYGLFTVDGVIDKIAKGQSTLWLAYKGPEREIIGAFTIHPMQYELKTRALIHQCGGEDVEEWIPEGWKVLRPWVIENGFDGAEIIGRKGWAKLFPEFNSEWVWLTYVFD